MTSEKITVTASMEARIGELLAAESFYRDRCLILAQLLIDSRTELNSVDVESKARIAGLEEELRQARQHSILIEEVTDAK